MAGPYYEPGTYGCQIMQVAFAESKNGNPMIVFRIKVVGAIDIGGNLVNTVHQYDRTVRVTLTEKSAEMVAKKLRWAGWNGTNYGTLSGIVGTVCRFVCDHETQTEGEYAGKVSERWDFELPPLESKPLENNPAVEKRLNALFGKVLKDIPPRDVTDVPEEKRQPAAPSKSPAPPEEHDIPF